MVKVGIRKPSLKSSIKARTTGRAKRAVKRAVIPGYGRKGMGLITDPKKSIYNRVYSRTTVGVGDIARVAVAASKGSAKKHAASVPSGSVSASAPAAEPQGPAFEPSTEALTHVNRALLLCIFLGFTGAHRFYGRMWGSGLLYLCTCGLLLVGWIRDIVVLARSRVSIKAALS